MTIVLAVIIFSGVIVLMALGLRIEAKGGKN